MDRNIKCSYIHSLLVVGAFHECESSYNSCRLFKSLSSAGMVASKFSSISLEGEWKIQLNEGPAGCVCLMFTHITFRLTRLLMASFSISAILFRFINLYIQ